MAENDVASQFLGIASQAGSGTINVNAPPVLREPPAGIEAYARPNVPLDVTQGASLGTRIGLSFIDNPENRRSYLRNAFQGSTVDQTPGGQFIIRNVLDPSTGQAKDLVVDEEDISAKDLGDLVGSGVKFGVGLAAMWGLGAAVPAIQRAGAITRLGAESVTAAAAEEGVGLTVDALQAQSKDFNQILREHAVSAGKSAVAGFALGGAVEGVVGAKNMLQGRLSGELAPGASERVGLQALENVNREMGTEIRPSIGQMSADPDILRLESYLERLPFFGAAFRRQRQRQEASIRDLQEKLVGTEPLQPMSEAGARLADVVQTAVNEPRQIAALAESNIANRAASEIENVITSIQPSARSFTTEGTSALTKFSAHSRMEQFKSMADRLFSEGGNPELSTAPLKPLLARVREGLPKRTVINESDLVDVAGRPLATTEGKEIVRELVPSELQRFLAGLDSLDATMPLSELRRIRNTVDNAISEGRGLEGVSTYELKQVQHALTETINEGAKMLGDGDAGKPLLRANAFYRENIENFEVPFIARLLKDSAAAPGFIGSHELVDTIRANPDRFNDVKRFLLGTVTEGGKAVGRNSESTYNVLRRSILEDIFSRSRVNPGTGNAINSDAFLSELKRFKPEVQADLLGIGQETLEKNLDLLKQLKGGFKDVPMEGLDAFLRFPSNSVQDLSKLATARRREAELFQNEVISKILKNGDDIEQLASDKGLDWLMASKNKSDIATVMAIAADDPVLVENIRRNAVARLFQEVAQKTKPSDAAKIGTGEFLVSPTKLIDAFRDPENADRLRLILGQRTFNIMENFAKSQAVIGREGASTLLGTSTATSMLTHMLRFFRNVPHAAKLTIYSTILTNPTLQRAVAEGSMEAATDPRAFAQLMIASVPVLEALADQYGKTGAEMVLQAFRDGATFFRNEDQLGRTRERQQTPAATNTNDLATQFLNVQRN